MLKEQLLVRDKLPLHVNPFIDSDMEDATEDFMLTLKTLKKNFMAPFYGWGSTPSRLQPLRGGS